SKRYGSPDEVSPPRISRDSSLCFEGAAYRAPSRSLDTPGSKSTTPLFCRAAFLFFPHRKSLLHRPLLRRFSLVNCGMQLALEFCGLRSFSARLLRISFFEFSCSASRCSHAGRLPHIMILKILSTLILGSFWFGQ